MSNSDQSVSALRDELNRARAEIGLGREVSNPRLDAKAEWRKHLIVLKK